MKKELYKITQGVWVRHPEAKNCTPYDGVVAICRNKRQAENLKNGLQGDKKSAKRWVSVEIRHTKKHYLESISIARSTQPC